MPSVIFRRVRRPLVRQRKREYSAPRSEEGLMCLTSQRLYLRAKVRRIKKRKEREGLAFRLI